MYIFYTPALLHLRSHLFRCTLRLPNYRTADVYLEILWDENPGRDISHTNGLARVRRRIYALQPFKLISKCVNVRSDHITTPASILSTALIAGIINHLFQKQLAQLPPYNQVLREGLLLKRLSQFATEEPEPEPFEAEDDVEPEQHIRRHSVLSEDITLVMSDGSGSGSDAGASSGTGRGSFGGGSARGSFGSKRGSGSGSDSGGGSGSGRLSLDSTLSSGPEGTSDEDVQSGASGASDTIGGSEDNGTADKGEKPSEKPKNAGKGLTRRGLKKKGKSKATKKTKKTSKGKK